MFYKAKIQIRYPDYMDKQINGLFICKPKSNITSNEIKNKIIDFLLPKISQVFMKNEGDEFDPSKLKATVSIQKLPEEFIVKED